MYIYHKHMHANMHNLGMKGHFAKNIGIQLGHHGFFCFFKQPHGLLFIHFIFFVIIAFLSDSLLCMQVCICMYMHARM